MRASVVGIALAVASAGGGARVWAQDVEASPWDSVANVLGSAAVASGGTIRYNFPRSDLTVRVRDVVIEPSVALGSWAGFGTIDGDTVVMGDLVVTTAELGRVERQLAADSIAVTAVHNHLVGESPRIMYIHFMGRGSALDLAHKVARALDQSAAPRPVRTHAPRPVTIDTARVYRELGTRGTAEGPVAKLGFRLAPDPITLGGHPLPATITAGSPVNLQAVGGSRVIATGDFAVTGIQIGPLRDALVGNGIEVTALHSHLIGETPTLYYLHFWADGPLGEVLRGLRAALDAAR